MAVTLLRGTPVQYELKRVNRFVLEFPTELGIESWLVETSGRPNYTSTVVDVNNINTKFKVIGKYNWEDIDIKFIDPIGTSSSQKIMEWVRLHSESVTGRQGYAAGYKKDLVLKALDPTGVPIEKWTMYQCMIKSASFGENDLGNDALQMTTIGITMDWAVLEY
jgi:hypothetical protein